MSAENVTELTPEAIQRYIRPECPDDMVAHHGESIPVVDLGRLIDSQTSQQEATVLKSACEDWGFFQVLRFHFSILFWFENFY